VKDEFLWGIICVKSNDSSKYRICTNIIDRKHVDFLLCNPKAVHPFLGIELDDNQMYDLGQKHQSLHTRYFVVQRSAKSGFDQGKRFWACSNCPKYNMGAGGEEIAGEVLKC
jgi:hypothetical protein